MSNTGPTARLRLEKQANSSNASTWGDTHLNNLFDRVDESICGRQAKTVSGAASLSTANYAGDEAHYAVLDLSGTGGTLTIPGVEKVYKVRNAASGAVAFTTGSGRTFSLSAGALGWLICDAVNVDGVDASALAAAALAAANAYTDTKAFSALPDQTGHGGNLLKTDGAAASWVSPSAVWSLLGGGDVGKLASVDNAHLASSANTLKGNAGSGTADLTPAQATALLGVMAGDAGAGGTKGLVPAAPSGSAAAGKFLKADGTFALPDLGKLDAASKSIGANGYVKLSGLGLILQWGLIAFTARAGSAGATDVLNFPTAFSAPPFQIQVTPRIANSGGSWSYRVSSGIVSGSVSGVSATIATWAQGSTDTYDGLYWIAVGPA